ncbi:MAG: response regulator [Myxococcota bacterium]
MSARPVDRVLVVEDNDSLRITVERALSERFPEVRSAASVSEAVALLASWEPDLLVMDVELPDGSAVDVMRAAVAGDRVPLAVAMSGEAAPTQSFELAQLGVRTYLPKPFGLPALGQAIDDVIANPPDLGPLVRAAVGQRGIHDVEEEVRATMVKEAMARSGGSRRGAARLLAVSRQLIQHMLRRLDGA